MAKKTLKLNLENEYCGIGDPMYKEYFGTNLNEIPKIFHEKRFPMSISEYMKRRLEVKDLEKQVKAAWNHSKFYSNECIFRNKDKLKVGVSPKYKSLSLDISYSEFDGEELTNFGKINEFLTKHEAKEHSILNTLVEKYILNDYIDYVYAEIKKLFGYDKAMGVFSDSNKKIEFLGLEKISQGSKIFGNNGNDIFTRLIAKKKFD